MVINSPNTPGRRGGDCLFRPTSLFLNPNLPLPPINLRRATPSTRRRWQEWNTGTGEVLILLPILILSTYASLVPRKQVPFLWFIITIKTPFFFVGSLSSTGIIFSLTFTFHFYSLLYDGLISLLFSCA